MPQSQASASVAAHMWVGFHPLPLKETLKYSRVCARDRFWSAGKARCRSGSDSTGPVTQRRQGPKPAGPFGLGRIFPEGCVALLDRRMTAALRSAPCLGKNADTNAGVRILQRFLKRSPRERIIPKRGAGLSDAPRRHKSFRCQSDIIL